MSESHVVIGATDSITFATGTFESVGTQIVLTAPNGYSLVLYRESRPDLCPSAGEPSDQVIYRFDGTFVAGGSCWAHNGDVFIGAPADGTWQWSIIGGSYASVDGSEEPLYATDITLHVAGRSIRAGFKSSEPSFNNPQVWNWHLTAEGETFQDDRPGIGRDLTIQAEEDPDLARYFHVSSCEPGIGVLFDGDDPCLRTMDNPDGSTTVYYDIDNDGQKDPEDWTIITTPGAPDDTGLTERSLLHEEGIGIDSQPLPPVGTEGVPVQDVEPQPGEPVPDHDGAGPVETPEVGQPVGVLSSRDEGVAYCLYFTPEGGLEQELACAGRAFLGPVDPLLPREDTTLVYYDPEDVPATGPIVTPDVPPTSGQETPDVPPLPVGSLGDSPAITIDVDVSYRYDADRIAFAGSALGNSVWSPVGPADAEWMASPTNPAALTLTITVYKDGVSQGTVGHAIPGLGQVLAAAEMTAGTL